MDIEIILQIRQEMGATKKSKLNGFVLLKLSSKKSLNALDIFFKVASELNFFTSFVAVTKMSRKASSSA